MNEHNMHPLTKAQSDFAAQNYEMVFSFLSERKLDTDEYHDAVIMHFLRAVQVYDERLELRSESFSKVAAAYMAKAVAQHLEKMNRQRTAETLHACGLERSRQSNIIHLHNAA